MNFPQKRQSKFRVRLQVCVYLIILLTLEEEGNQLFRQLSVELVVRLFHFVHFIHPDMNPLPFIESLNFYFLVFFIR